MTSPILQELHEAVQGGERIDYPRLFRLQALAVAEAGERFVAEAAVAQEEADERWSELAGG